MAKDPRFNFYPDNWEGGTDGFTLEQEGAYLKLIILQSRKGRFTQDQAINKLLSCTFGDAAAAPRLWDFLKSKFETDGKLFWSARLEKEIEKSKRHSEKQSERAKSRYSKEKNKKDSQSGTQYGTAAAVPVIEVELELELEDKLKGAFDEIYIEQQKMKWPHIDFDFEYRAFCEKVRGSPDHYRSHDSGGIRLAFQAQLRNAKPKMKNGKTTKQQQSDATADYLNQYYRDKLGGNGFQGH